MKRLARGLACSHPGPTAPPSLLRGRRPIVLAGAAGLVEIWGLTKKGPPMGRTPNYRFDRMQRDKAKADKKAEKAAAKAKKAEEDKAPGLPGDSAGDSATEPADQE